MIVLSNVSVSEESRLKQENVQAYIGSQPLGNGTLVITEGSLTWVSSSSGGEGASRGFSLTYPSIILHAISTDRSNFAEEHIYVLVDGNKSERRRRRVPVLLTQEEESAQRDLRIENEEMNGGGDEESDNDSEAGRSIEIRFVPDDKTAMAQIYHEMTVCQELNPDENDDFSDEDGDAMEDEEVGYNQEGELDGSSNNHWYTADTAMEDVELSEEGMQNLRRMMGGSGPDQNGHGDAKK